MKLCLIVLNKVEVLDKLLHGMIEKGITGATILNSTGMVKELANNIEDYPILGTISYLLNNNRKESKTIFTVIKDEQVETLKKILYETVGDLTKPDTAVFFILPVLSAEGVDF